MNTVRAIWISLACSLFAISIATTDAVAENLTFRVQSMASQKAQIVFYSQDRRIRWPGPGRAYSLNDYEEKSFPLSCITNEKICYGAWTTPNQKFTWGTGPNDGGGCRGCCYTCGGGGRTQLIVLRNPVRR
jgi:hypothetical protein